MVGGKPPFRGGLDRSLSHSDGAVEGALLEAKFFKLFFATLEVKSKSQNVIATAVDGGIERGKNTPGG